MPYSYLSLLTQVGLVMIINIVAFFLLGLGLEKLVNTNGFLFVILIVLGVFSGFYNVYKVIDVFLRKEQ